MDSYLWNLLLQHAGHNVEIAIYGKGDDIADVCLEDIDTGEVIIDAELYELVERS